MIIVALLLREIFFQGIKHWCENFPGVNVAAGMASVETIVPGDSVTQAGMRLGCAFNASYECIRNAARAPEVQHSHWYRSWESK